MWRRITGTGLSLVGVDLAVEHICFQRGYEFGVVTAVSGGISRAARPGRFLPRRVTVSRLELWLSYSPDREGHGLSPTRLPLTFAPTPEAHTHAHTPYNPLRKVEVIWNLCILVVGVFSICAMLSHQSEIIAGCQSTIYWESRGKRAYDIQ